MASGLSAELEANSSQDSDVPPKGQRGHAKGFSLGGTIVTIMNQCLGFLDVI